MGSPGRTALAAAALAALACIVVAAPRPAAAGDAVVAKTLLESGRKSFNAKKYDEAETFFRKAYLEDPALIEAVYWRAQTGEKKKDDAAALSAYREFLSLAQKKAGAGGLSAEETKLRPLAEKRVAALAVAEGEFQKLEDKYVEDLLGFARAKLLRDPGVALRAVERILEARPDQGEALSLRDKLSGTPASEEAQGSFPTVKEWIDLIHGQAIRDDAISFGDGTMDIDQKSARRFRPASPVDLGKEYALETEFRIVEAYDENWLVGFTLADTKEVYLSVDLHRGSVDLNARKGKDPPTILGSSNMTPIDLAAWHRLGVGTKGDTVEVWFDGKLVLEKPIATRIDLAGDWGLVQGGCRTQRRVLRAGKR